METCTHTGSPCLSEVTLKLLAAEYSVQCCSAQALQRTALICNKVLEPTLYCTVTLGRYIVSLVPSV